MVKIDDGRIFLSLDRDSTGHVNIHINVGYYSLFLTKKSRFHVRISNRSFQIFRECLANGVESMHGHSSNRKYSQIQVLDHACLGQFRNVRLHSKSIFFGWQALPVSLSEKIVSGIANWKETECIEAHCVKKHFQDVKF